MPKGTMLDRLAGAMKTLSQREGKALTPSQRVAAAQRWNSLANISKEEWTANSDELLDAATASKDRYEMYDRQRKAQNEIDKLYEMGLISEGRTGENPFLSDNIDKYREQSDFLEWCRYNGVRPSGQTLKQFRTEKIYDEVESGNLGGGDAVFQVFNAAGGFSPETGYEALDGLHSRMNAGDIGVLDAMDEAYLRGLRVARKRKGW